MLEQASALELGQKIGVASAALVAVAMGLQRVLKSWKAENAESSIISLMRTELERLSSQNTTLTSNLNKFQLQVIALNESLGQLSAENSRLQKEVNDLSAELSAIRANITKHN